jgi:hypothetical protein
MHLRIADAARALLAEPAAAPSDASPGTERRAALLAIAGQAPGRPSDAPGDGPVMGR